MYAILQKALFQRGESIAALWLACGNLMRSDPVSTPGLRWQGTAQRPNVGAQDRAPQNPSFLTHSLQANLHYSPPSLINSRRGNLETFLVVEIILFYSEYTV